MIPCNIGTRAMQKGGGCCIRSADAPRSLGIQPAIAASTTTLTSDAWQTQKTNKTTRFFAPPFGSHDNHTLQPIFYASACPR